MVRTAGKDMCWTGVRWRRENLYVYVLTELMVQAAGQGN